MNKFKVLLLRLLFKDLYQLWINWSDEQNISWYAENGQSFVIWLEHKYLLKDGDKNGNMRKMQ